MNKLIKKLLREHLLKETLESKINDWKENIVFPEKSIVATLIAYDQVNENELYLFVGFRNFKIYQEYSYSFMLIDKNNKPLTGYMTKRDEVAKYLPNNLKKKGLIFPIIKELTRELLRKMTPEEVHRTAVEIISGESLYRYDEITKIFVNEFGYKDVSTPQMKANNSWRLVKTENTEKNSTLNEEYILNYNHDEYIKGYLQRMAENFDRLLPHIKAHREKRKNKLI